MYIKTVEDFNEALKHGPYAWPGGYPHFFLCADGEALSYKAAEENADSVRNALIGADKYQSPWLVVSLEINWEDTDLYCSHTNERIESAYGEGE